MGKVLAIGLATVGVVGTAATALRLSGIWERTVSWGIDPVLSASALPGDDLVVDPIDVDTRTLEIAAPPSAIWSWLVQMGDHRGGEYSYSVFGFPHRKGADRIVPEWQDLTVGDPINEWVVRELEPERTLVLYSDIAGSWSWAFILEPMEGGRRSRLVERIRVSSGPPASRECGRHAGDRALRAPDGAQADAHHPRPSGRPGHVTRRSHSGRAKADYRALRAL